MKILVITSLFPDSQHPTKGIFNKQQFAELAKLTQLELIVPIPWFPKLRINEKWYKFSRIPQEEMIDGIKVYHPRYLLIPKLFRFLYGISFFLGILGVVKKIYRDFSFNCILATWAYPDGFGSFLVSKVVKKPIIIKVHGTDINLYTKYFLYRKMIIYAFKNCYKVIAVSAALKNKLVELSLPEEKIEVIPNGVDVSLFRPMDKQQCRRKLSLPLDKKIVLYAGNLEKIKGIDLLVGATEGLVDNVYLVIVGDGRLRNSLRAKVRNLGLKERVYFAGTKPHSEMPLWMNAADVFCLPSRNEGCPNVLLEALACGRPVVATGVGGIPEIIRDEGLNMLVEADNISELRKGIEIALERRWDIGALRQGLGSWSWQENVRRLLAILKARRSRLNILYHHRTQGKGGEGVHIKGIVKALKALGNDVIVISPPGIDHFLQTTCVNRRYKRLSKIWQLFSRYSPQVIFELFELMYNLWIFPKMKKILQAKDIDLIYERYAFFCCSGVNLAKRFNIPFILEVNEVSGIKRTRRQTLVQLAKRMEKKIFKDADAIVTVSDFLKRHIETQGIDSKKISVITNAIDPEEFKSNNCRKGIRARFNLNGSLVIGFVGMFCQWDNLDFLIEAFSDLIRQRADLRLMLIGTGRECWSLEQKVEEYGIRNNIIFTGLVRREEIADFIDALDICVIPNSNPFGSPLVLFEYMAMAKSVLAARVAPIERVIKNNENGILFSPEDRNEFKRALNILVSNSALRERLGQAARDFVLQNHTWIKNAEKIINIYQKVRC